MDSNRGGVETGEGVGRAGVVGRGGREKQKTAREQQFKNGRKKSIQTTRNSS